MNKAFRMETERNIKMNAAAETLLKQYLSQYTELTGKEKPAVKLILLGGAVAFTEALARNMALGETLKDPKNIQSIIYARLMKTAERFDELVKLD